MAKGQAAILDHEAYTLSLSDAQEKDEMHGHLALEHAASGLTNCGHQLGDREKRSIFLRQP